MSWVEDEPRVEALEEVLRRLVFGVECRCVDPDDPAGLCARCRAHVLLDKSDGAGWGEPYEPTDLDDDEAGP